MENTKNRIESKWMTTAETAEYLKCSVEFLNNDRVTNKHGIPYYRLGRSIRYHRDEVDAYMAKTLCCTC